MPTSRACSLLAIRSNRFIVSVVPSHAYSTLRASCCKRKERMCCAPTRHGAMQAQSLRPWTTACDKILFMHRRQPLRRMSGRCGGCLSRRFKRLTPSSKVDRCCVTRWRCHGKRKKICAASKKGVRLHVRCGVQNRSWLTMAQCRDGSIWCCSLKSGRIWQRMRPHCVRLEFLLSRISAAACSNRLKSPTLSRCWRFW